MNAKTCLATTGEGIARAELTPYGNWDVWAYFGCGSNYMSLQVWKPALLLKERITTSASIERMLSAPTKKLQSFFLFEPRFCGVGLLLRNFT